MGIFAKQYGLLTAILMLSSISTANAMNETGPSNAFIDSTMYPPIVRLGDTSDGFRNPEFRESGIRDPRIISNDGVDFNTGSDISLFGEINSFYTIEFIYPVINAVAGSISIGYVHDFSWLIFGGSLTLWDAPSYSGTLSLSSNYSSYYTQNDYTINSWSDMSLVPEPSIYSLLLAGGLFISLHRRRYP